MRQDDPLTIEAAIEFQRDRAEAGSKWAAWVLERLVAFKELSDARAR